MLLQIPSAINTRCPLGTLQSWSESPLANLAANAQLALVTGTAAAFDAASVAAAPITAGASLTGLFAGGAIGKATGDAIKGLAGTFDQDASEQAKGLAVAGGTNIFFGKLGQQWTKSVEEKAFTKAAANAISTDGGLAAAQKEAQAALQATNTLKQYGIEVPTLRAAITQNSQDVAELVKHSQTEAGQVHLRQVSDVMDGIFHKIADAHTGGAYSEAVKGETGDITKRLSEQVVAFQKGSGKEIEAGRNAILEAAGDESYAAPKFQQAVKDAASSLGLLDQKGNVIPGNEIVKSQLPDDRVARTLYDLTQKHGEDLFNNNGTMQANTLLDIYNGLAKDAKIAAKGSQYSGELFDLRRAALDDFHAIGDAKGVNLDTFTTHGNYRKAVETADVFSQALDNNAISAQAFADQVINPKNLEKSLAMQAVIKPMNPGLWNDLVAQKLANITRTAMSNPQWDAETGALVSGKMNYAKVGKDMYALGKENVESMLGEGSYSRVQNLTGYLTRMQQYVKPDMTLGEKQKLLAGASKLGSLHGMAEFATNAISGLFSDKEGAAKVFFSNGADLDAITKGLAPAEKSIIQKAAKRAGYEVGLAKAALGK
jgi:hypothetical protein